MKKDIRKLEDQEILDWVTTHKLPAFRARQITEWLWQRAARDFDSMSNIPKELRETLKAEFIIRPVVLAEQQVSSDRTIKSAFRLYDDNVVEGVLIPTTERMTACISSQAGCSLSCLFCATGRLERIRNLDAGEIFDQVVIIRDQALKEFGIPLSNIVYMGMGEPLLNYTEVVRSISKITSPDGLGMSPQRITVSTAGIAKMIRRLGDDGVKFNLALSLHAANDNKRNRIMPVNEQNSLDVLAEALNYFYEKTGTRVTYEYIIFKDFNDSVSDAEELAAYCRKVPSKVNIIEYNPIDGGTLQQTTPERLRKFVSVLENRGIIANVRRSRGKDIDAACGQLANKNKAV
ncbi:MAG: 23S rRNA (adenine(2503)-C(2))-methyltransferase RlmN [Bacteroidia bacterium]|nr:23S rRNA (adenine(2503)-C(2))-methyltransferase RlmN [Bacteroidia bacterium]